jgi:hypothetical protein
MAIINQTQFETYISSKLGTSYTLSATNTFDFNSYVSLYEGQLMRTGLFTDNITRERQYRLKCGKKFIPISVWSVLDFEVYRVNIPSKVKTLLVENIDYIAEDIYFENNQYYKNIDLSCLSCSCECDYFIVKGKQGFQINTDFQYLIMNIIYNNIVKGATIGGDSCCANIQSKSIGDFSVNYKSSTTVATQKIIKNSEFILSYPIIMDIIHSLQYYYVQY